MATYIEMPKLSDTMTEGTLVKWRKKEGDQVEAGEVIAEVETDKATMEMEAFDDGILHQHLVSEGAKVPIGSKIALLLSKGEEAPANGASPGSVSGDKEAPEKSAPSAQAETEAKPQATVTAVTGTSMKTPPTTTGPESRIRSSPLARKLAREKGMALEAVTGSGPGGRIIARDIERATPGETRPSPAKAVVRELAIGSQPGAGDQRVPLSGMRRVIAERLLTSKTTIPHFYLTIEVDAGPLMKLRSEANAASEAAGLGKLTINDLVLKGVIAATAKVPAVNASFAGDSIIQYGSIHLAVAVAVEEGLVTPVIRDAQKKSLREISDTVKDLATRARSKKLKPDEYQGGTLTVSNLGSYGVESFSAIINPPQAIIISIGAIVKKPVVGADEAIVPGQRMAIGLSADHRVVDGAIGAHFLSELRKLVENPTLMLL